jgi:hypothetical protein
MKDKGWSSNRSVYLLKIREQHSFHPSAFILPSSGKVGTEAILLRESHSREPGDLPAVPISSHCVGQEKLT